MHGCVLCAERDFNRGHATAQREREAISGSSRICSPRIRAGLSPPACIRSGVTEAQESSRRAGKARTPVQRRPGKSLTGKAELHPRAEASTLPYAQGQANCFSDISIWHLRCPHS